VYRGRATGAKKVVTLKLTLAIGAKRLRSASALLWFPKGTIKRRGRKGAKRLAQKEW